MAPLRHASPLRPVTEAMEERVLHSADLGPLLLGSEVNDSRTLHDGQTAALSQSHEIAFIDATLADADALRADLLAQQAAGRAIEIVSIDSGSDGLALITRTLAGRNDISAVHLLAHGSDGVLQLGTTALDAQTLLQRAAEVAGWGSALSADADLLLYGCDVAQTALGRHFVQDLAALTGADVAASSDLTGAAARGGNWTLEYSSGAVEAPSAASAVMQQQSAGLLGVEFNVNTTTTNQQSTVGLNRGSQQAVSYDAAGNFVVVWTSTAQDQGGTDGVYARRFAADGSPLTGEILVNSTTAGNQNQARVASDDAGNFVVTWTSDGQDGDLTGVYARRFSGTGAALSAEIAVNSTTAGHQQNSVIGMNSATGAFVVAWQGNGVGDAAGIYFRRFAADGSTLDATERAANLTDGGTEQNPAVAMDTSGRFVIASDVGNHLYFQRFDAAGIAQGGRTQVDNGFSNSVGAAIAMDAAGNFTLVYRETTTLPGVWGRGYLADGTQRYSWFYAASGDATAPSIAMADDGTFVVVYEQTGGSGVDILARRYTAGGSPVAAAFVVNQTLPDDQSRASVALHDSNLFVVVWSGGSAADSNGVLARTFDVTNVAPVVTTAGTTLAYTENQAATAIDPSLTVSDTDNTTLTGATISISANHASGQDVLAFTNQLGITGSWNAASGVLTLSGTATLANYQSALRTVTYSNSSDNPSTAARTISFVVSDGVASSAAATRSVSVAAVNDAPTAQADAYTTAANTALVVTAASGLLTNDSDADGGALQVSALGTPAHGSVSLTPAALGVLTNLTGNAAADLRAAWSPDGSRIAFDSARDGNNEIYVMNADGSGLVRLTSNAADDSQAAWSPDGSTIAFMSSRGASYDIWVMNATDGSGLVQLTSSAGTDGQPAWSPDGSQIAFTSDRAGSNDFDIYVMAANGTGVTRLTTAAGDDAEPDWSPDGSRIAFSSTRDGNSEIYVMNANGTGQTRLTNDASLDRSPTWSPDGTKLAFASNRSGTSQIYIMDADGGHQTAVTSLPSAVSFPDWSQAGSKLIVSYGNEVQTASVVFDGAFVYTPDAGYSGTDSFSYTVTDGQGGSTPGNVTITVAANVAPAVGTSGGSAAYVEGAAATAIDPGLTVSDADSANLTGATVSITANHASSQDVLAFTNQLGIVGSWNATSGVLTLSGTATLANYQSALRTVTYANSSDNPSTAARNISFVVSDGVASSAAANRGVSVAAVNDAPIITSNGGGATANVGVAENTSAVTTVTATDAEGSALTYSIVGGADAARFSIDGATGALRFVVPPNFESPSDSGANNVYELTVRASDGSLSTSQAVTVTVTNINEAVATTVEQRINSSTGGVQETVAEGRGSTHAVAISPSGDHVVVWSSQNQDGSGWGVYGQRYDASGALLGAEFAINQVTANDQQWATVAMDASGRFVISWTSANQDGTPQSIYARTYSANGSASGNEFRVNTTATGSQHNSSVAMDANGNFVVIWQGNGPGDNNGIFGRRFDATGTALDAVEFLVNTDVSRTQYDPSVSMNASGAFAVIWDNDLGVQLRRYDSSGVALGGEINVDNSLSAGNGSVALADDGSVVVVWRETLVDQNVYLQRYSAAGAALGGAVAVNATLLSNQTDPSIAMDGAGNFIVAWEGSGPGDSSGVFGQRFDADGNAVGGEFLINSTTTGTQAKVSLALLDLDNFVAVWSGQGPGDTAGVFARQFGTLSVAPVITSNGGGTGAAITVAENSVAVTTVTATDADLPAQSISYSIVGGDDAGRFSINATTGVLRFNVAPDFEAPNDVGADNIYNVIVQASDGTLSDTQAIAVTVTNVNDNAPASAPANAVGAEDTLLAVTLNATDADGSVASFTVQALPAHGTLYLDAARSTALVAGSAYLASGNALTLYFSPDADWNGITGFDFFASDSFGLAGAPAHASLTIAAVNDAPVAANGSAATGENAVLSASVPAASDADGSIASYVLASSVGAANGSLTFNADGSYVFNPGSDFDALAAASSRNVMFTYRAVDNLGVLSSTATMTLTVNGTNDAPALATPIANQNATEDAPFNFVLPAGTFVEADAGDTLTYAAILNSGAALPSWLAFDSATRTFSGTPANADVGSLSVRITVSDGASATAFGDFVLSVANTNDAPLLTRPIDDQTGSQDTAFQFTVPAATFTDADAGDTLSYDATLASGDALPGWLAFDAGTQSFSGSPLAGDAGLIAVRVTATDTSGASAQTQFAIAVVNLADPMPEPEPAPEPSRQTATLGADTETARVQAPSATQPSTPAPALTPPPALRTAPALATLDRAVATLAPELSSLSAETTGAVISARSLIDFAIETRPAASRHDAVLTDTAALQFTTLETNSLSQLLRGDDLQRKFDEVLRQMTEASDSRRVLAESGVVLSAGLSIGYVVWLVRGGVLLSSMVSALPAWQMIDPMPVLAAARKSERKQSDADEPEVERLFDGARRARKDTTQRVPSPTPQATADRQRETELTP